MNVVYLSTGLWHSKHLTSGFLSLVPPFNSRRSIDCPRSPGRGKSGRVWSWRSPWWAADSRLEYYPVLSRLHMPTKRAGKAFHVFTRTVRCGFIQRPPHSESVDQCCLSPQLALIRDACDRSPDILETLRMYSEWGHVWKEEICPICCAEIRKELRGFCRAIWNKLPEFFEST